MMRGKTCLVTIALLVSTVANVCHAQGRFDGVEFETTHVAGSVYVLVNDQGGNIGVSVGPDGVLMVDDQFAPLADKILAAIRELGGWRTGLRPEHTSSRRSYGRQSRVRP